jgi:hypothetical protein
VRQHLSRNVVAYVALFVALGGTGAFAASKVTSSDIKDNTIKGKDIRAGQVAGSDLRDGSASGADVLDGSLTGADVADKSLGGGEIDPATKVPNADMLDGHGSSRYGVGLQMGLANELPAGVTIGFPSGLSKPDANPSLAIAPELLELRDFTTVGRELDAGESVLVSLWVAGDVTNLCTVSNTSPTCSSPGQQPVASGLQWGLQFTSTEALEAGEGVSFSYRAVR